MSIVTTPRLRVIENGKTIARLDGIEQLASVLDSTWTPSTPEWAPDNSCRTVFRRGTALRLLIQAAPGPFRL